MFLLIVLWGALPHAAVAQQISTGWCSPNIANVTGPVTVNCIGVDPRALKRLNAQLGRQNVEIGAKIQQANEWAERYHELEKRLTETGDDTELSRQAAQYLKAGELEKAGAVLVVFWKRKRNRSTAWPRINTTVDCVPAQGQALHPLP